MGAIAEDRQEDREREAERKLREDIAQQAEASRQAAQAEQNLAASAQDAQRENRQEQRSAEELAKEAAQNESRLAQDVDNMARSSGGGRFRQAVRESSVGNILTLVFFLLALLVHVWDAWNGFPGLYNWAFLVYAILGLKIGFFASSGGLIERFKGMLKWLGIAVIFGAVLPRLLTLGLDRFAIDFLHDWVVFLLAFFPIFILSMIYSPEFNFPDAFRTVANWYIGIWLLILLVAALASFSLPIADNYVTQDTGDSIAAVWGQLWDAMSSVDDTIIEGFNRTAQLANPNYYVGRVEDNKQAPDMGVKLEEVGPLDPFYTPELTPIVTGYISANSFLEEQTQVTPTCVITSGESAIGIPDQPVYEVFYGSDEYFECEFPQGLDPRRYPVEVSATFDFETWAYLPYEFVLDEKIRDYARLQQDIYRELDITKQPVATYTDGPVALGVGGSRNPIPVHTEEPYLRNAKIGFSVSSAWPRGEIEQVNTLILSVPRGFAIGECNRPGIVEGPFPDENVVDAQGNSLYNRYEFKNTEGPVNAFTGITCDLELDSLEDLPELVGNDKATRSFVALAEYSYTVSEETSFRVRE